MEEIEKKIEEAAENFIVKNTKPNNVDLEDHFVNFSGGSFEKDCWISGAKSEAAKQYWQQGMYSEEEVKELLIKCLAYTNISILGKEFENWFNKNKKK